MTINNERFFTLFRFYTKIYVVFSIILGSFAY